MKYNQILYEILKEIKNPEINQNNIMLKINEIKGNLNNKKSELLTNVSCIESHLKQEETEYNNLMMAKQKNDFYQQGLKINIVFTKIVSFIIAAIISFSQFSTNILCCITIGIGSALMIFKIGKALEIIIYKTIKQKLENKYWVSLEFDNVDLCLENSKIKTENLKSELTKKEKEIEEIESLVSYIKYIELELNKKTFDDTNNISNKNTPENLINFNLSLIKKILKKGVNKI